MSKKRDRRQANYPSKEEMASCSSRLRGNAANFPLFTKAELLNVFRALVRDSFRLSPTLIPRWPPPITMLSELEGIECESRPACFA